MFSERRRHSCWQENQERRVKGSERDMLNHLDKGQHADSLLLAGVIRVKLEQEKKNTHVHKLTLSHTFTLFVHYELKPLWITKKKWKTFF